MFQNKNLLVISPVYNFFVKDQVDLLSYFFHKIYVLVGLNPIAEISNFLPINYLKRFRKKTIISLADMPENVIVIPTPLLYAPTDYHYKKLGRKHFKVVDNIISENKINFDLIHSHFTWSSGYVGVKLKEKYGKPFVVTAHGFDIYLWPFKDDEWKKKIECVLNGANQIITVSQKNLSYIKKLNCDVPVHIIPNGFRRNLFSPRNSDECLRNLQIQFDKKIILSVGNLLEVKGYNFLLKAVYELIKYKKDIMCIIIGVGPLKNKLHKQIRKLGLEDYIKLLGGKPHNEIPLWMNACDIFAIPSLNEGNPTVMFEALGCGKPVIATRVGGIPEVISSDDYGLLVNPGDFRDLAEKLLFALEKKWDYKKIVEYSELFTWDNIVKKILEVYGKALTE